MSGLDDQSDQEAASIMLLRVALRLLGEARLRGDFGNQADLAERAATLADEMTGGTPSPDPRRAPVEAELLRPDRISLAAPFKDGGATTWSLMLDGTLFGGRTVGSVTFAEVDPQASSPEEVAELERLQAEWQAQHERLLQFTATRFVRAVTAPPQPSAEVHVLAALLYEDGFYIELTHDTEPASDVLEMTAGQFFTGGIDPEVKVEDDLGTEYFESGGGGGGGVRVWHSSRGFAPAPPPEARLLQIKAGGETSELDLRA
jgi:hypothetical protein